MNPVLYIHQNNSIFLKSLFVLIGAGFLVLSYSLNTQAIPPIDIDPSGPFNYEEAVLLFTWFSAIIFLGALYGIYTSRWQSIILEKSQPYLRIRERIGGSRYMHQLDYEGFVRMVVQLKVETEKRDSNQEGRRYVNKLLVYLERKNGSRLLLMPKGRLKKSKLKKVQQWAAYIPLPKYGYCPSHVLRERYRAELEGIPEMLLESNRPPRGSYHLYFSKKNEYQLPRSKKIRERQRWLSEKEPNIDIWYWSRKPEIPAYLMAIVVVGFFSFVFLKLAIHERDTILLWVVHGVLDLILLGLLYTSSQLFFSHHLISFHRLGIRYALVHSPKDAIPQYQSMAYSRIYRMDGPLNGKEYVHLLDSSGSLLDDPDFGDSLGKSLKGLNLRRLLSNFRLFKKDLHQVKEEAQEAFGTILHSKSKKLHIPMEYVGIGERLYFEEMLARQALSSSS